MRFLATSLLILFATRGAFADEYFDPDLMYQQSMQNQAVFDLEVLKKTKWQFLAGLGYHLLSYWQFTGDVNYVFDGATTSCRACSSNVLFSNTPSLIFEARRLPYNMFGIQLGAMYSMAQAITKMNVSGGSNNPVAGVSLNQDGKFDSLIFYANFTYKFVRGYIPVGLSYGAFNVESKPPATMTGGIGYQFGFGFEVADRVHLEWGYWQIPVNYGSGINSFSSAFRNYLVSAKYSLQ